MLYSFFSVVLRAYIDPAATSILLSSITAIVVAAGATFLVLWRKFKKGVVKTLHIDPNAGKEVEDDLVLNDEIEGEKSDGENTESSQTENSAKENEKEQDAPEAIEDAPKSDADAE